MALSFEAIPMSDSVYWVGAIDWSIRNFHGYSTNRGTSYNAFLILDDHVTLIDTVKYPFKDELLSRISSVIPPEKIDYIISNHAELDHSGCLNDIIEIVKPEKVFASKMGVKTLSEHFPVNTTITPVKDGEKLSLGKGSLQFFETKMLHWPESMVSYYDKDKVLFSQDGFGMHLATTERFDDQIDFYQLKHEAAKYYANILLPFSARVQQVLEKIRDSRIEINLLATDHGPVWRSYIDNIFQLYSEWSERKPGRKVLVLYDTMWHSTTKMAHAITDGLLSGGTCPKVIPVGETHRSDVATELLDASAIVVGSPTLNNNILPTIADVLTYIKGLKPAGTLGAAFGSYGWSGESVKQIEEILTAMKIELVCEGLKVKFVPTQKDLEACFELGKKVADRLTDICDQPCST